MRDRQQYILNDKNYRLRQVTLCLKGTVYSILLLIKI